MAIFILAFILRLTAANTVDINPDEMAYAIHPINIISAGRLSTQLQSTLYSYLSDVSYSLFGFDAISSRLPSILFGSFSVLVIYLISIQLFNNKKIGLFAAFLFAISGYALKNNVEPDPTAFFFLLLSIFFFIKFLQEKNKYLYFSAITLGLAILCKVLPALIIISYAIFYLMYCIKNPERSFLKKKDNKWRIDKKVLIPILLSGLLLIVIVSPVFVYNYLLYKDTGITDYYFSTLLGIGENLSKDLGGQEPWSLDFLKGISKSKILEFAERDLVLMILGLMGLIYLIIKKNKWTAFLLISILSLWLYLAGRTASGSHYIIFLMLLSIPAGVILNLISEKIKSKWNKKYLNIALIVLIFILAIHPSANFLFNGPSSTIEFRNFAQTISDNSIIIVDPLIYRGITAWALNDKHYLEGNYYGELINQLNQIEGQKITVPFYYIECGRNSRCGWKPEDYDRVFNFSEGMSQVFKSQLPLVQEVKGHDIFTYIVYKGEIPITPNIYEAIDRTQQFYFYPVGWKYPEFAVDNYTLDGFFEKLLSKFGFFVLYINVLLALVSLIVVIFLIFKNKEEKTT